MYSGPHIIKDGLVFGYDTGYSVADNITATRFYKGAPTVNYIHHQNAVAQDSYTTYSATSAGNWNSNHPNAIRAYSASGGDITGYYNGGVGNAQDTHHGHWQYDTVLKKPVVVMNDVAAQWKAKSFGTGLGTWTSHGKVHGDTYTISWLQWVDNLSKNAKAGLYTKNTSNGSGFHDGQANSASSYNTKVRTWQRVYQTYTTNSVRDLNHSLASIYMYGHYNVRATVKIADVQFTWGSTPFPYSAEYERTSTASLVDLTKTTDIDVSNVSFDSTGQPTFDGTDDYINLNSVSPLIAGGDFSLEAVIKGGTQDHKGIITINTSGGGNRALFLIRSASMGIYDSGTWYIGNIDVDDGNWHHVVLSYVRSTKHAIIYVDGNVSLNSTTNNMITVATDDRISIGQEWDGSSTSDHFNGQIPVAKIYNQALSATEVQQNFKAYKNRFDI